MEQVGLHVDIDLQLTALTSVGGYKLHIASGVQVGFTWFETDAKSEVNHSLYTRVSLFPR